MPEGHRSSMAFRRFPTVAVRFLITIQGWARRRNACLACRRYRWVQKELKMTRRDLSSVMSRLQRSPIALSSPCHFGMSDSHLLAGNFLASRRIKLRASLRMNRRGRTAKVARHTALQFLGQNARWRRQRAELQNQCPTTRSILRRSSSWERSLSSS
jgi:hypothetical protein